MNFKLFICGLLLSLSVAVKLTAQISTPDGFVIIKEDSSGFDGDLDPADRFSRDHDKAGDINGDGIIDLVVGARSDDDGETDAGAVYILFMNNDGTVQSNQKISMLEGDFSDELTEGNFFGYGVAGIGDYDSDGIPDIAVSAPVPPNRAIYIIHLNADGTVKDFVKNSNITAMGLTAIGDLNLDNRIDLVACDPGSDDGGGTDSDRGAIQILFFNASSQIANTVVISSNSGGFGTGLADGDQFGGREVAMLGDMDGDGTKELAVGAFMSYGGKGSIWILSLDNSTYNVVSKVQISEGLNGFTDTLTTGGNPNGTAGANFGHAMCAAGDMDDNGVVDLITGANQQNEGWAYILYLNADKTVKTFSRINNTYGGFGLELELEERFSRSISFVGDLRGDGSIAINIGGGAGGTGTLYLLFFKPTECIANYIGPIPELPVTGFTLPLKANGYIHITGGIVESGEISILNAGTVIVLKAGFSVLEGAYAYYYIEGCDGGFASPSEERSLQKDQPITPAATTTTDFTIAPNPFYGSTNFQYSLLNTQNVSIEVLNATGVLIATPLPRQSQDAGEYRYTFEANNLPNGIYLVVLEKDGERISKRMVLAQ